MASQCPKCHRPQVDDSVCCADVTYTWKCQSCSKLTQGFVAPYGKCFMCGGNIKVVEDYDVGDWEKMAPIREAVQMEVDMYNFYKLATAIVGDAEGKETLTDLFGQEKEHIEELRSKYHLELDDHVLDPPAEVRAVLEKELFAGVEIKTTDSMKQIYEKALELEKRTAAHFRQRADSLPDSPEQRIYKELAAEEEEHVALLETEMQNF